MEASNDKTPKDAAAVVAIADRQPSGISAALRARYDATQVNLIRNTVAADCTEPELAMFLELCARYELDPFAKQIWAMKISGKVQIVVSRDGLLALANRYPDFRGCESDVVRDNDYFRKFRDPDKGAVVEHEYRDAEGNATASEKKRGGIIGAWALVHREGHYPTYFYATWDEYSGRNVWASHPSAMMQKVPETMALRKAFSVTGIIGETELDSQRESLTAPPVDPFGDDPLGEELRTLVAEANALVTGSYRDAKVRARLLNASQEAREDFLAELKAFIAKAIAEGHEAAVDVESTEITEDPAAA